MVAHIFNPSMQEADADESLWVRDKFDLHKEFQNSQGYVEKPCHKQTKKKWGEMHQGKHEFWLSMKSHFKT